MECDTVLALGEWPCPGICDECWADSAAAAGVQWEGESGPGAGGSLGSSQTFTLSDSVFSGEVGRSVQVGFRITMSLQVMNT